MTGPNAGAVHALDDPVGVGDSFVSGRLQHLHQLLMVDEWSLGIAHRKDRVARIAILILGSFDADPHIVVGLNFTDAVEDFGVIKVLEEGLVDSEASEQARPKPAGDVNFFSLDAEAFDDFFAAFSIGGGVDENVTDEGVVVGEDSVGESGH